jgi:hypothetical protein
MATITQTNITGASFGSSPRTINIGLTLVAGRALVVFVNAAGHEVSTVTDNGGGTYVLDATREDGQLFRRVEPIGVSPPTSIETSWITEGNSSPGATFWEISDPVTLADSVATTTGFSRTHTINIDTDSAADVVVGMMNFGGGGEPPRSALVPIGGITRIENADSTRFYGQDLGAAGTKTVGFSWSESDGSAMGCSFVAASYSPASAPAATPPFTSVVVAG